MLEESVSRWASDWLEPQMEECWAKQECPEGFFKELGNLGGNGVGFEEKYGGSGLGYVETTLVAEAIGRANSGLSGTYITNEILCFDNIRRNAMEKHKMEILPKACRGELIGCLGLTEPNAGSDAMSVSTTAVKKGDRYIINGSKTHITNAPIADVMLIYAKTEPEKRSRGISAFWFYTKDVKGLTVDKLDKIGFRLAPSGLVAFDDVEIPAENLVGEYNNGVNVMTSGLCTERITLSGSILGQIRSCLELSLKYAKERVQFGQPIASFQFIQGKLADMYCDYRACKLMAYSAASYIDSLQDKRGGKGTDLDRMAAAAILYCGEKGMKVACDAVQIHGGYGVCSEYAVTRDFLDAKIWEIGAGTNEIRRIVIARELLRDDFRSGN